jgi:hypothetical protein
MICDIGDLRTGTPSKEMFIGCSLRMVPYV